MGAEDVPGPDRVVVLVDLLVAAGCATGCGRAAAWCGCRSRLGPVECLVGHEPSGPDRPLEEPMLTITLEPGQRGPPASRSSRGAG